MKRYAAACVCMTVAFAFQVFAQEMRRDQGRFVKPKNEFYDQIKLETEKFRKKDEVVKKAFKLDFSAVKAPDSTDRWVKQWHTPPISQGRSGMCWCFSATSFLESEIYRLSKREIKLSEPYTVYWEYVEKARRFVRERGASAFAQGSECNAVPRVWKQYGIVPAGAYPGMKQGQVFHDQDTVFNDMNTYLTSVKKTHAWNEEVVLSTIKAIMNHHMGEPPPMVAVDGKTMSPKDYLEKIVRLNPDDYIDVMSLMEQPYYRQVEFEVPDNWWHSRDYVNVPLDDFMTIIKKAIRNGYTLAIGGDTSEPGYDGHVGIGVVPTFDIPSAYIDENARQMRFSSGSTGDDHGIHLVGYLEKDGKDWYLIKDSGSGSRNNASRPGYYYYHEDYVKLKMLSLMVHKDAVKEILARVRQ